MAPVVYTDINPPHVLHSTDPTVDLYVPTAHAVHGLVPVYPALQIHTALLVPAVETVQKLPVQAVHAAEPMRSLYSPTAQAVQGPPSAPV